MISFVRGLVAKVGAGFTIIDVNGIGMHVHTTLNTAKKLEVGQEARLDTVMVVKEDSRALYGFADEAQKEIFELLITVSGVGPRIAVAVLNTHGVATIRNAVACGDDKIFSQVSGIGVKGAKKIVLELSGKVSADTIGDDGAQQGGFPWEPSVREALVGLGWSEREARFSIADFRQCEPKLAQSGDSSQILRGILRLIDSQKAQGSASRY